VLVAPGDAIGVGTITEDAAGVGVARTMRHSAPVIGDRSSVPEHAVSSSYRHRPRTAFVR
jgi:hypothetical protein